MTGKKVGYIRVSTLDQNPGRQLEGVALDKKFIDYASSRSLDRPEFKIMMDYVREEDIVYVHSIDRLARNIRHLLAIVDEMKEKKIELIFLKENLHFNGEESLMSRLMLTIMGAFAEVEYEMIRERQREGIVKAKAAGKYKGGTCKMTPARIERLKQEMLTHKSKSKIARELGISRMTLYRYLKEIK